MRQYLVLALVRIEPVKSIHTVSGIILVPLLAPVRVLRAPCYDVLVEYLVLALVIERYSRASVPSF